MYGNKQADKNNKAYWSINGLYEEHHSHTADNSKHTCVPGKVLEGWSEKIINKYS